MDLQQVIESLAVLARVCRADWKILLMNPNRDRLLASRDPVPESTIEALRRLRGLG